MGKETAIVLRGKCSRCEQPIELVCPGGLTQKCEAEGQTFCLLDEATSTRTEEPLEALEAESG